MPKDSAPVPRNGTIAAWVAALRRMPNDSIPKTLLVAVSLCLVCAVLVSTAAVALKPLQVANRELDRKKNILVVAGIFEEGKDIDELFQRVEIRVIDLATGEYVEEIDPAVYDQRSAAKDPERNRAIPPEADIARIKTRARHASVYLVREEDRIKSLILPVHGLGLYSTLYGFIALQGDANTVVGLTFYEQAETPGLGGEISNPRWLAKWPGKLVYDESWTPRVQLVKGGVADSKPESKHQVDALAGATLTSRGVTQLLRYWLSENGFGPFLANIRSQGDTNNG